MDGSKIQLSGKPSPPIFSFSPPKVLPLLRPARGGEVWMDLRQEVTLERSLAGPVSTRGTEALGSFYFLRTIFLVPM